jgi:glycosyltransferase involved in cell wall biosynthesis
MPDTKRRRRILFIYQDLTTFINKDLDLLKREHQVEAFHFSVKSKPLLFIAFIKQFFFLIKKSKENDIILVNFAGYVSFLPVLISKFYNSKCIVIVAGTDAASFKDMNYGNFAKGFLKYATCFSLRNCDYIVNVHESLEYQEYTYDSSGGNRQGYSVFCSNIKTPSQAIYYSFNSDYWKPSENIQKVDNIFVTVGNLSIKSLYKRKGFSLIIQTATQFPQFKFVLIGAPEGFSIKDKPENVELLPFMPQKDLVKWLSKARFYLQLSMFEGMPNALCEAMLCRCIPIGSNVSGIPFVIGDTGFIVNKRSVDLFARKLEEINELSPDELDKLSDSARARISTEFTHERRLKEFNRLFNKLLES